MLADDLIMAWKSLQGGCKLHRRYHIVDVMTMVGIDVILLMSRMFLLMTLGMGITTAAQLSLSSPC